MRGTSHRNKASISPICPVVSCSGVLPPDQGDFQGKIALTFAADPHLLHTPTILAALAAHEAPATFFINGSRINDETTPILEEIVAHPNFLVANHGMETQRLPLGFQQLEDFVPHLRQVVLGMEM